MNVTVTVTKIIEKNTNVGRSTTGDQHLSIPNARLYSGEGSNLAVRDMDTDTIYQTDFAYSGVAAVIAAAPGTGGFFLLT